MVSTTQNATSIATPNDSLFPGGVVITTPFTVKYDPNGVLKFVLQGEGAGGTSVAVDPAGDILLTGAIVNFGRLTTFSEATKIHPSGAKVWVTQIPATGKIVSDSAGNVFVAGSHLGAIPFGFLITKLSPAGGVLFTTSSLLPDDMITDAVVDPFGNLLATGFGPNAQSLNDIFTVRLK